MKSHSINQEPNTMDLKEGAGKFLFRFRAMAKKEFRLFASDKGFLIIALVLPPLLVFLFAFLNNITVAPPNMQVVLIDGDNQVPDDPLGIFGSFPEDYANYALDFKVAIENTQGLHLDSVIYSTNIDRDLENAQIRMENQEIQYIIILPANFSELITLGDITLIECIIESADSKDLLRRTDLLNDLRAEFENSLNYTPDVSYKVTPRHSVPDNDKKNSLYRQNIVNFLPSVIVSFSLMICDESVIGEKPISRLLMTPLSRFELLLSKYLVYSLVGVVQVCSMVVVMFAMGLYIEGTVWELMLVMYMLSFSGISFALFLSVVTSKQLQTAQLLTAYLVVNVLLSGLFVPIDGMPNYLQTISIFLPNSHGAPILDQIIMKGNSIPWHMFDTQALLIIDGGTMIVSFIVFFLKKYQV